MTVLDPSEPTAGQRAAARKERLAGWRVGLLASPAARCTARSSASSSSPGCSSRSHGGHFLTTDNVVNMLQRSVALGIVAVGQTLVILAGSLDLSVAALIRSPRSSRR